MKRIKNAIQFILWVMIMTIFFLSYWITAAIRKDTEGGRPW